VLNRVAVDTGTTLIYLPIDIASRVVAAIPGGEVASARVSSATGLDYIIPCDASYTFATTLGNQTYNIDIRDLNVGPIYTTGNECGLGIINGLEDLVDPERNPLAILGDAFLKSVYTSFDYSGGGQIGFAQAVNTTPEGKTFSSVVLGGPAAPTTAAVIPVPTTSQVTTARPSTLVISGSRPAQTISGSA
jgi:hypothetical protein